MIPPPLHHRWALVTGASSGGMGEAFVLAFMKRGINVISTAPDHSTDVKFLKPPVDSKEGFVVTMPMDVTSPSSITSAVARVRGLTDGKLHYLVNMAGYGYYMPLMDVDVEQAKKQYDVNVWGIMRVTQAFFPMLLSAQGMVLNQASIAGVENFNRPFMGIYSSSKAAVMSLSSTLRVELAPFGIDVVALVTSAVKTEFFQNRHGGRVPEDSVYYTVKDGANEMMGASLSDRNGHDRYEVAEKTVQRILEDPVPIFVRLGYLATLLSWMYWLLPVALLDWMAMRESPLGRLKDIVYAVEMKGMKRDD